MTTPAIETIDLTKRFRMPRALRAMAAGRFDVPERVAVDDVSLSIPQGQVFGLLGQNGAGKTTLVRMLTTLLLPTSGTARIDGIDVARDPLAVRSRVGLVNGDERSFYWRLTGPPEPRVLRGAAPPRQALPRRSPSTASPRRLGMTEHIDRPFRHVVDRPAPGPGDRARPARRAGSIVFMDEPTRSLDPISALRLRRFVAEVVVGELGRTVVLATHSMPEAETLCDRLGVHPGRSDRGLRLGRRSCGARSAMGRAASFVSREVRGDVTELDPRGARHRLASPIRATVRETSDRRTRGPA